MKRKILKTVIGAGVIAGVLSCSISAYATTIDDVIRVAREFGYPEDNIQQAYNQYYAEPDKYTSEDFDESIQYIYETAGILYTTAPQTPVTTTTTVAGEETPSTTTVAVGNETPQIPDGITLQTADGSKFTRISKSEFINMSYDEKMNYIRTFTPEQQQVIFDNLSPEERKSMLKQLPVEQKAEIADSMANFAETFDLNVSIDELSEDNISMSMRNDEGELVGIANVGTLVEDTGYDRRGILGLSAGLIAAAGVLLAAAAKCFRTGDEK
ncbi:MAG: hypothetical protein K2J40_11145 [Ruminococcus sp.]|nr:hypothetical protein [Ruminococcus sp.]